MSTHHNLFRGENALTLPPLFLIGALLAVPLLLLALDVDAAPIGGDNARSEMIVPTLQRGNGPRDAPASRVDM